MAPTQPLRVVFAEDNYLVRAGTTALLAEIDDVDLVRLVEDPRSLIAAVGELAPDAVLTDIRMPPTYTTEGITAAKRIRAEHPGTGGAGPADLPRLEHPEARTNRRSGLLRT
jgi:DNA-binding NarL/FixJ family response regulator